MITQNVLDEARKLWDYHHMHHTPAQTDCILALGSYDLRVADRAAADGCVADLDDGW